MGRISGSTEATNTAGTNRPSTPSRLDTLQAELDQANRNLAKAPTNFSPASAATRKQLTEQRDQLTAMIAVLRSAPAASAPAQAATPAGPATPAAAPKLDPKLVKETVLLSQLNSLSLPYGGGSDAAPLGAELFRRTIGRIGTDEQFVFRALELAHLKGNLPQLNAELGARLRQEYPGVDSDPLVRQHPTDGYLRFLVDKEMSGSEAQRAIDFIEVGTDRNSSSTGAYLGEGAVKLFDGIGDALHDHPVKTTAMLVGGTAALVGAVAAAPVIGVSSAIAGATIAATAGAVQTANLAVDAYRAATATNDHDRAQALVATGSSLAGMGLAAMPAAGAGKVLVKAGAAAGKAETASEAARAFLSHGSNVKGAAVASAAQTAEKPPAAPPPPAGGTSSASVGPQPAPVPPTAAPVPAPVPAPNVGAVSTGSASSQAAATAEAAKQFRRPVTAAESSALGSVPSSPAARDVHSWLRRLEQSDPKVYETTLKQLESMPPAAREKALGELSQAVGNATSPATDLQLARDLAIKESHAYSSGARLTGEAAAQFRRPVTPAEASILDSVPSNLDVREVQGWLRRLEQADPTAYNTTIKQLEAMPAAAREKALSNVYEAVGRANSPAKDVQLARDIAIREGQAYAWGERLTGEAAQQFNRPVTQAEAAVYHGVPATIDTRDLQMWLRRLEQVDPKAYDTTLKQLEAMPEAARQKAVKDLFDAVGRSSSPESDLQLARDLTLREGHAYSTGARLTGEAASQFNRPMTNLEASVLDGARSNIDSRQLHAWMRRLEQADPKAYETALKQLDDMPLAAQEKALDEIYHAVGSANSPAKDLQLARDIAIREGQAYSSGARLTGAAAKQFRRPITAAESSLLESTPAHAGSREILAWMRRLEQADPKAYDTALKQLESLPPATRAQALEDIYYAVGSRNSPATDLQLARDVALKEGHAYTSGARLTGEAATQFRRQPTPTESAILQSAPSTVDVREVLGWLRRLEHANPKAYETALQQLESMPPTARSQALQTIYDAVGSANSVEKDLQLARDIALRESQGYSSGARLTGEAAKQFRRPVTAAEASILESTPAHASSREIQAWLRRLEQVDPKAYDTALKQLESLPPTTRAQALEDIYFGVGSRNSPATDLQLARDLALKEGHAYTSGARLTGQAATQFRRQPTPTESAILQSAPSTIDAREVLGWLRRLEHADPKAYETALKRLESMPPGAREKALKAIYEAIGSANSVEKDLRLARELSA